ncbi:hypothetical protein HD554DRAFT_1415926 [Boletus coccyginus]|nr:hypothetical protein HD554DRAFT_1415926 [Boletus coccyginus]
MIGTLLVGIFFNTYLYGLVTYQFAVYYQTPIKYMVLFLFVLDTFHSASVIYLAWYYTVANYGNPAALGVNIWPYAFTPTGVSLAALVTHIYLSTRIWRLTSSKILYGTAMMLAILSFILGMITAAESWTIERSLRIFSSPVLLNRLIRGAIQTGLFASTFSLGNLVTFVLFPNTALFGMFAIPIGRIYTNDLDLAAH